MVVDWFEELRKRGGSACRRENKAPDWLCWLWSMQSDDPALNTCYSEDGVDLTLIRWMLSLTPAERLQVLEDHLNDVLLIRELNA